MFCEKRVLTHFEFFQLIYLEKDLPQPMIPAITIMQL